MTCRPFGAYSPAVSPDGKKLAYADLSDHGYSVVEIPLTKEAWTPLEKVNVRIVRFFEPLLKQEQGGSVLAVIPETTKKDSSALTLSGSFSPYGWMPWIDTLNSNISVVLSSANYLQTVFASAGGSYNLNEKGASAEADIYYTGLFPTFTFGGVYGKRYSSYIENDQTKGFSWFEKTAKAAIGIPLNFSRGLTATSLKASISGEFISISERTWLSTAGMQSTAVSICRWHTPCHSRIQHSGPTTSSRDGDRSSISRIRTLPVNSITRHHCFPVEANCTSRDSRKETASMPKADMNTHRIRERRCSPAKYCSRGDIALCAFLHSKKEVSTIRFRSSIRRIIRLGFCISAT